MNDQTKIATAVLAGYLLGRTKQGKRALRMALWLGGGSSGVASALGQQGLSKLEANPAIGALLTQIRGPLVDASRKALTSALENRASSLADNLQSRTEALSLPGGKVRDIVDSGDGGEGDEEEEEEAPRPRQRRPRSESARRSTRQADADAEEKPKRPASSRTGRAKRDDAKAPAKKTASRTTSKTAAKGSTAKRGTARSSSGSSTRSSTGSSSRSRGASQSGSTRRRGSTR